MLKITHVIILMTKSVLMILIWIISYWMKGFKFMMLHTKLHTMQNLYVLFLIKKVKKILDNIIKLNI